MSIPTPRKIVRVVHLPKAPRVEQGSKPLHTAAEEAWARMRGQARKGEKRRLGPQP